MGSIIDMGVGVYAIIVGGPLINNFLFTAKIKTACPWNDLISVIVMIGLAWSLVCMSGCW